jgi:hypothetical protein
MSLLRSNFALNVQAIHSGAWQTLKMDGVDVTDAPSFRLQYFSEATNQRYQIALNNSKQRTSPFYGWHEKAANISLFNNFIKDCLIEFGLKDWKKITKIDVMSDKEISERTLKFIREEFDPLDKTPDDVLPSVYTEKYLSKDGILTKDGRTVYYDELISELVIKFSISEENGNSLLLKASAFFEAEVPCTQRNIRDFFNEPRNSLALRFCTDAVFVDRPFRSLMDFDRDGLRNETD